VIGFNQRTLCLGPTGSGKSELLNAQLSALRTQRVLYDSKDEFSIAGVEPARDVDAIDWRQPVVHFVPGEDVRADAQAFFSRAFRQPRPLVVCVHELADLCEYRASATPAAVNRYIRQGRSHGKGLLGASQRPVEMPVSARSEPEHVFVFTTPPLAPDDMDEAAGLMRRPVAELHQLVEGARSSLGTYSFLYFDRSTGEIKQCPPLPDHMRRRTIVARRSMAYASPSPGG
jgi:energy-coupling factor transporter ATP-binding protein EcfA2